MPRFLSPWIAVLLFSAQACMAETPAPSKLDVFYVPWPMHRKVAAPSGKAETPPPNAGVLPPGSVQFYPLHVNRISDALPGKLYDVREFFTKYGVKFAENDFAWYNPDAATLVVRASPADMELIEALFSGVNYDPPSNVVLEGRIRVGNGAGRKKSPLEEQRWRMYTKSGQESAISAKGGATLGYRFHIQPTVEANGEDLSYQMELKVTFGGREYEIQTSTTTALGKQRTTLLGTTPKNEEIFFDLTPTMKWEMPAFPYDDPKKKAGLMERIQKSLDR
ncbi:MAG: hypothetical protein PHQ12_13010 [Chthoniobacteraceae bacterium]|nr:hypothetical protein [Chthoniobacteraceae bacterium]